MECNFTVGQMVVCINANGCDLPLEVGRIYTISGFVQPPPYGKDIRLLLEETDNGNYTIPGYRYWRFRAVRKTDISDLVKLMEPVRL